MSTIVVLTRGGKGLTAAEQAYQAYPAQVAAPTADALFDYLRAPAQDAGDQVRDDVATAIADLSVTTAAKVNEVDIAISAAVSAIDSALTAGTFAQAQATAIGNIAGAVTTTMQARDAALAAVNQFSLVQSAGEAAPVVAATAVLASTYVFDQAVIADGYISRIRIAQIVGATNVVLKVKRFTRSGATFTPVANGEMTVSVVAGNQTKTVNIAVKKGEYLGFYTGVLGLSYAANSAGAPQYWAASGDIAAPAAFDQNSGGGTTRLMLGYDVSYLTVTDARIGTVEQLAAVTDARSIATDATANGASAFAAAISAATRLTQTIGIPTADALPAATNGAVDAMYVLATPIAGAGVVRSMRVGVASFAPVAGSLIYVQRFTRSGNTFIKVGEVSVSAVPGINVIVLNMAVKKGEYIGLYASNRLSYSVAAGPGYYTSAGSGNQGSFDATRSSPTIDVKLALAFELDYYPVTADSAATIAATATKSAKNETVIDTLAGVQTAIVYSRTPNGTGQWTGTSANFRRWRTGVLGSGLAGKRISRWIVTLELPAAVYTIRAMLFARPNDANVSVGAMGSADVAVWATEAMVTKSSLPSSSGFVEVAFADPAPFVADSTKAYYLRIYATDTAGAGASIGMQQSSSSPDTAFERGFYGFGDSDATWSAIGSGQSLSLRVESDAYQIRKDALPADIAVSVPPDLLATPIVTITPAGALTAQVSGYLRRNGANTQLNAAINFPTAAAGMDRIDLIVIDRASLAISRVAGGERSARVDSPEYMAALPANTILLGRARVNETTAIAVNTAAFAGLAKVGIEGEYAALVRRNRQCIRRTLAKATRGGTIKLAGYGDSITALQGGGSVSHAANGDGRDRIGYLGSYAADTKAAVPKFDLGRGVTDNIKIGWNWSIKAALDSIAGGDVAAYYNYGIPGSTSAATLLDATLGNGLYPPRLAVPLAAGLDMVVIAFGMNERGSGATYANLVNMAKQFLAVGTEVVMLGCPRPYVANSVVDWRYTEDAIEAAAIDCGVAYVSTAAIADDRNLGGIGLPAECLGATNIAVAGNHPGVFELAQYGRACVTQLGL